MKKTKQERERAKGKLTVQFEMARGSRAVETNVQVSAHGIASGIRLMVPDWWEAVAKGWLMTFYKSSSAPLELMDAQEEQSELLMDMEIKGNYRDKKTPSDQTHWAARSHDHTNPFPNHSTGHMSQQDSLENMTWLTSSPMGFGMGTVAPEKLMCDHCPVEEDSLMVAIYLATELLRSFLRTQVFLCSLYRLPVDITQTLLNPLLSYLQLSFLYTP
ncbi:hypothetical protein TURU_135782 [Turdus rufiventris]|nr:hypothetical protein TURU_135782 [Turdus rufiventris]